MPLTDEGIVVQRGDLQVLVRDRSGECEVRLAGVDLCHYNGPHLRADLPLDQDQRWFVVRARQAYGQSAVHFGVCLYAEAYADVMMGQWEAGRGAYTGSAFHLLGFPSQADWEAKHAAP